MPLKPPVRGSTHVEVHTPPLRPGNETPPRIGAPGHFEPDTSIFSPGQKPRGHNKGPADTDLDAILPESSLTINELSPSEIESRPLRRPLEDYRVPNANHLPAADAQGLRSFKGRLFVDGYDGSTLHVGRDPESGLYRAKLQSEQKASGPDLLRDPETGLWHPLQQLEAMTFALSASRLQDYRTALDFGAAQPDSAGLYHFEKRVYAVIEDQAYQVMHDLDASSPELAVMRIVRPADPVASDENNRYVATRPGKSEPVFFNRQIGWTGLIVGGAGGMFSGQERSWRRQLGAAVNQHLRSAQSRARKLFPAMDQAGIEVFIQSLGGDVAAGLTRRETQLGTLKQELKTWSQQTAAGSPGTWAKDVSAEILRGWRRETGTTLTLPEAGGALPALKADFEHIESLNLRAIEWSDTATAFLGNFSALNHLSIVRSTLGEVPAAILGMHNLTTLDLHANRIKINAEGVARLSAPTRLEQLDLSHNTLGVAPDLQGMSALKVLNLSNTAIEQWPTGLQTRTGLKILDLRNNRLRAVPPAYLNPPAEQLEAVAKINGVTLLDGNPFPADYWQHFDAYWQRLHLERPDLLALATPGAFDSANPKVERYRLMFPDKTLPEARQFIRALGAGAEPELLRLEREYQVLEDQLGAWSFSGGGAQQRYVRANQMRLDQSEVGDRYEARRRIFQCWRRETPQKLANDGTPIGLMLDLSGLTLPSLPDLDVDFSHVGALKLNNMNLSASPEGFLSGFRHVRWLDLSNNQLRDLPPAIGEMHAMTRLFLQNNQIMLTPDTARILSERVTLRALMLEKNPLGIAPDFSLISDMRSLNLANTRIDAWPNGLAEQPSLDLINLAGNRITTIPDSVIAPTDSRLAQMTRINDVTNLSDNPLSDATMEQVQHYAERLNRHALTEPGRPNRLVATAHSRTNRRQANNLADSPFKRWSEGLSEEQTTIRRVQWQILKAHQGSDPFFEILNRLKHGGAGHTDQQRRVWDVLDTMSENSPESERLRDDLFNRAGEPACCDRAAFSFGNLEVLSMAYKARTQALDQSQGQQLADFSRRLFRLHEVDKFASLDIKNSEAILRDPHTSAADRHLHSLRLSEEVEIRLAYRFGLKARLDLPGQPEQTSFTHMGKVDQDKLDNAHDTVKALDNSPQEREALLSREFWKDYLTNKHRQQFEDQRAPFQDRLADLHDSFVDRQLTEIEYKAKSEDLQAQLAIEEAALMQTLTIQELDAPAPGDNINPAN
ncbi:NEL-type E3 ubiquitin ligase domain-containing protein [Pseudomonas sp. TWP3-1]|uniref:NEL-type E3 ubiquitin ligase domain-containing protein n=1 Tax=Pseudomonas sp. TWP3-1 TaxID=2804631 RepID=UPI003CF33C06